MRGVCMKKGLKITVRILLIFLVTVLGYAAYVFLAYYRIGDSRAEVEDPVTEEAAVDKKYKIVSWNIGFGAYEDDFGFFMDGGTEARAWSEERLIENLSEIGEKISSQDADFVLVQEVDTDATRSYHVDETEIISDSLKGYTSMFAQNYDSPFLFYPVTQPFGSAKSGIMTFSKYAVTGAERKELPVETGVTKLLDLDRCYSKSTVPFDNGKELILYNFHLSAYTSDGKVTTRQLELLLKDMQAEYEKGNYVIGGGDFNKDVLPDSQVYYGGDVSGYTWVQPIPEGTFNGFNIDLVCPFDPDDPVPSCRNADGPYNPSQIIINIDGFLVSDNVEALDANVIDYRFENSDHNPVYMNFILR